MHLVLALRACRLARSQQRLRVIPKQYVVRRMGDTPVPLSSFEHFSESSHDRTDEVIEALRTENFDKALEITNEVLQQDKTNFLALYQKGTHSVSQLKVQVELFLVRGGGKKLFCVLIRY